MSRPHRGHPWWFGLSLGTAVTLLFSGQVVWAAFMFWLSWRLLTR